jgi:XRE family aerobic/anaerobic benzoate catabolism transcriptional regulator
MVNETEYLIQLGDKLRRLRIERGISQQILADNSNVAKSTVQRIENGSLNPSIMTLKRICDYLVIPFADLLD